MPETVMKHRKRVEAWSAAKAAEDQAKEKKLEDKKKIIFKRAEDYVQEYRDQVFIPFDSKNAFLSQEADLKRLARQARLQKGFFVPSEPKLAFVIRIKGINKMHPKVNAIQTFDLNALNSESQNPSNSEIASIVQWRFYANQQSHGDDAASCRTLYHLGISQSKKRFAVDLQTWLRKSILFIF